MRAHDKRAYPLTGPGLIAGAVLGGAASVFLTPLMGFSLFVLCCAVGLTWRDGEPPIFPFILTYQWVAVCIAMFYEAWGGEVPRAYEPADLDLTVRLSLIGLLLLAAGMRIGAGSLDREAETPFICTDRGVTALFWVVMGTYAIDYVQALNPREYLGMASFVEKGLQFRHVLLLTLWAVILTQKRSRILYLVVSFFWVLIPTFGRYYSDFRIPIFLLVLALTTHWRPWDMTWWRRNSGRTLALAPIGLLTLGLAVFWQGAIKHEARTAQDQGLVSDNPLDRVQFFVETAQTNFPELMESSEEAVADLIARLSYVTFFSRALEYTPAVEPHAEGELLWMAVVNGTVPRFLFPDKPELPVDSEYTRRFAGVRVFESMDSTVSVSMGYMAEFYADWGANGMLLSVFAYGLWAGLLHLGVRRIVKFPLLSHGAAVIVLLPTLAFEHQFVRGFASLNIGFAVTVLLTSVVAPTVKRLLVADPKRPEIVVWRTPSTSADTSSKA